MVSNFFTFSHCFSEDWHRCRSEHLTHFFGWPVHVVLFLFEPPKKKLKDVQLETCLFGKSWKTPPPLCFLRESSLQILSMKTRPPRQFEVIKMIKSRVSVFFFYLHPYLQACQWTVGTWITFDRRNWQDTSFAPNFGLACIWNFVAMFNIFTHIYIYTCVFHKFWIIQKCIDICVYYLWLIYNYIFFIPTTQTQESTHSLWISIIL